MEKTNVMRILDQKKIEYTPYSYDASIVEGTVIALTLGEDEERVFKTLVTVSGTGVNFVFVIPVAETLDLKKAAKAVGMKSISMIKQKELLPLTGYIHGGCSPIGMKKQFTTVIDESADALDRFYVSAGKVGHQIMLDPHKLANLINAEFAPLTVDRRA